MNVNQTKLYFMCGKMAAGKSTHAKALAQANNAVLLVQDDFLERLFPDEIRTIPDFVKFSARLREALTPIILDYLSHGVSVVLDFPGNTRTQRQWFRTLFENANVNHELHFIDVTDERCKRQLKQRSDALPVGAPWTTDAEFDAITVYFQAPDEDEAFNVIRHARTIIQDV
jgi:predicted kinase